MRTRRSGGGCETMYCTNLKDYELETVIRDYYLKQLGISEPEEDIQDRSHIETPNLSFVENLVKEQCKLARGDKQCVFDPFPRYEESQSGSKLEKLSNRRVNIKQFAPRVLEAIKKYFKPEARATRESLIIARQQQRANYLTAFGMEKKYLGGKRRTRKRK